MYKILPLIIILLFSFVNNVESKIYKYTDEDGNVHYSDKKPFDGAQEAKLRPITIIESSELEPKTTWKRTQHKKKQAAAKFENFVIISPEADASVWGTGGNLFASVNVEGDLPTVYRVKFYIDGLPHGKVKSNSQLIGDIERGEHSIYAELINSQTRQVIKTTPTITFHLKQNSKK